MEGQRGSNQSPSQALAARHRSPFRAIFPISRVMMSRSDLQKSIIARRYAKDNMPELVRLLRNFREKLLAQGWDGKVE